MDKSEYIKSEFKMEFQPDRTPMMYAYLAPEFVQRLDTMLDGGSALFSNRLIMSGATTLITQVSRVNDIITLILDSEQSKLLKDDGIRDFINTYMEKIITTMETYKDIPRVTKFTPLFTAGLAWLPDMAIGELIDTSLSFNRYYNIYSIMLLDTEYDAYASKYKTYFKDLCKNIMKAKKVKFNDSSKVIEIIDANTGLGPTPEKAYAYTMAVLFALHGIKNALHYKDLAARY